MASLASYERFVEYAKEAILAIGILLAIVALIDWAVRTRRVSPFGRIARFFRGRVDPLLVPIERLILRQGGVPSSAAFWALLAYVIAALGFLWLLGFVHGLYQSVVYMSHEPLNEAWRTPVSWLFGFLQIALLVRVISTWLPVSPYSRWIRWSYVTTEWMLRPLRRVVPSLGPIDITPIIAWFLLGIVEKLILS